MARRNGESHDRVEFFCEEADEAPRRRHSLDACSLCRRPIGLGRFRDIYMYQGDVPFCSEDCRQERIDIDFARQEEEAADRKRIARARASISAAAPSAAGILPVRAAEEIAAS